MSPFFDGLYFLIYMSTNILYMYIGIFFSIRPKNKPSLLKGIVLTLLVIKNDDFAHQKTFLSTSAKKKQQKFKQKGNRFSISCLLFIRHYPQI